MVSPEMSRVLAMVRAMRETGVGQSDADVQIRRKALDLIARAFSLADDVTGADVDAGGVSSRWFETPESDPGRVVLYLHGGGFEMGSSLSHAEIASRFARLGGARTLVPNFRLAPEDPFPAALDDVLAAAAYAREVLDEAVGPDRGRLVVAGDSSGGGLAAALLVALRDRGEPLPQAAVLLSPWTDLTLSGPSVAENAESDLLLSASLLAGMAARYLHGTDPKDPLASPSFADLTGLPPLLVLVGTAEILYSDGEQFAAAAQRVGVDVTVVVGADMPHVWPLYPGTPESDEATAAIGAFLQRHLA